MARNRAPWASWHPARYGGSRFTGGAKKIVLHTMECGSPGSDCWPGYGNWGSTPHLSVNPGTGRARQHVLFDRSARALASPGGGRSPNMNAGLSIQIEIVGRAHDTPRYNDAWYDQLASWVKWLCDEWGIPKTFPFDFGESGTAGPHGKNRVSWERYRGASGIVGHQNVPFNDHWDPGNLNQARLLHAMGQVAHPHPQPHPAPSNPHHESSHWFRNGHVYVSKLHYGQRDSDSVRNAQRRLIALGFHIPAGATGNYLGQTDAAVRKWQGSIGDRVDPYHKSSLGPKQTARLFRGVHGITIHN